MRRLTTIDELAEADTCIAQAIKAAQGSTCQKSNRGVVIIRDGEIIGRGANNPPAGFRCNPEYCRPMCNKYCVHAEQNAILDALKNGHKLEGSRMYHIKIKEVEVRTSGPPSCAQCSKLVLQSGICSFVLKHDNGYGLYDAGEFHKLSLENQK